MSRIIEIKSLIKMFWIILSIFCLSTVVESRKSLVAQIIADHFIVSYSFLEDNDPNEIVNSLIVDTSIIGTDLSQHQIYQRCVDHSKYYASIELSRWKQDYLSMKRTTLLSCKLEQISRGVCDVSKYLFRNIIYIQIWLGRYLQNKDNQVGEIGDEMRGVIVKALYNLSNIRQPKVMDIATLKEYLNFFIVVDALCAFVCLY